MGEKVRCEVCRVEVEVTEVGVTANWTVRGGRLRCEKCSRTIYYTTEWKTVDRSPERQESDLTWLSDHGEDAASLRALVEAVDAAIEKDGGDPQTIDSRSRFVDRLSGAFHTRNHRIRERDQEICALEQRVAELEDGVDVKDPTGEEKEDVPIGGLSHEDAHFVLSGIKTAHEMLDAGQAWPDDAHKVARYLKGLLK